MDQVVKRLYLEYKNISWKVSYLVKLTCYRKSFFLSDSYHFNLISNLSGRGAALVAAAISSRATKWQLQWPASCAIM